MEELIERYPILFPVFFAGLWFVITTLLSALAGWFLLMRRFPDTKETAITVLRGQSGLMGLWVAFGRILTISVCPSGVRLSLTWVFGPFCRPFFVPWDQVQMTPSHFLFAPMMKLRFGDPSWGRLWIYPRTWRALVDGASSVKAFDGAPRSPFSDGALLKGLVLQWLIVAAVLGCLFASDSGGSDASSLPLTLAFGFPVAVIGVGQVITFLWQRDWR